MKCQKRENFLSLSAKRRWETHLAGLLMTWWSHQCCTDDLCSSFFLHPFSASATLSLSISLYPSLTRPSSTIWPSFRFPSAHLFSPRSAAVHLFWTVLDVSVRGLVALLNGTTFSLLLLCVWMEMFCKKLPAVCEWRSRKRAIRRDVEPEKTGKREREREREFAERWM